MLLMPSTPEKYKQAIELYSEALKMRPENAEIYNDLGTVYYETRSQVRRTELALVGKRNSERKHPTKQSQNLNLPPRKQLSGVITFKTRGLPAVANAIEEHARPTRGRRFINNAGKMKSLSTFSSERPKTYMPAAPRRPPINRALELEPTHSVAYRNLGLLLHDKSAKTDRALDNYQEAYKLDPRDAELEEYLNQFRK